MSSSLWHRIYWSSNNWLVQHFDPLNILVYIKAQKLQFDVGFLSKQVKSKRRYDEEISDAYAVFHKIPWKDTRFWNAWLTHSHPVSCMNWMAWWRRIKNCVVFHRVEYMVDKVYYSKILMIISSVAIFVFSGNFLKMFR